MDIKHDIDWTVGFAALLVLRRIRDVSADTDIAAFTGDAEKQYEALFVKINDLIMNSGLYAPANPSPSQKEKWMQELAHLERKLFVTQRPLLSGEDTTPSH